MHPEAFLGLGWAIEQSGLDPKGRWRVLDVGGQDVNGTGHAQLPNSAVTTLDLYRADIIADAATWEPDRHFDVVMATELFEHTPAWRDIISVMHRALDPSGPGVFLSTCASLHRPPHGAQGGPRPERGEWYANVPAYQLHAVLKKHFTEADVKYQNPPGDAYAYARGPL